MVTVAMAPPGSMPLLKAGNRQCSLRGEDDPMINQRTGSGKKANNPAGSHLKTEEPIFLAAMIVGFATRGADCRALTLMNSRILPGRDNFAEAEIRYHP